MLHVVDTSLVFIYVLGKRLISIETKSEIENVFVCRLGAALLARRGGLPPQTERKLKLKP